MNRFFTLLILLSVCFYGKAFAYDVIVAKDGSGNFTTVQAAIDAAPTNRTTPYTIYIKNGKYKEVVTIPVNKPSLQLIGESVAGVIITYDNYSGKPIPGGGGTTYGTNNCATLFVNAADCAVLNLTVENSTGQTGDGPQAVAMYVTGDRCVFKTCRFISGQDTIWTNGNGKRNYFRNCYIDGNTDFLFGSMIAVFDSCVIFPRDRVDGSAGGYVTAANTPAGQTYGYVFRDCLVPANRGITAYTLGRPWQNDAGTAAAARSNSKVVWLNTRMSKSITAAGWSLWDAGTDVSLITYAEYKTRKFDGTLTDVSNRVSWSQQLSDAQAAPYYVNSNLFGTWDPCSVATGICSATSTPLAVSNFRAKKGTSTAVFTWNIDWPVAGAAMDLLRSIDNVNFTSVSQQTTPDDTTVNYTYTGNVPPAGQTYYYILKISKSGSAGSTASDTAVVSSTPTINVTSALGSFIQGVGTPSSSQSYVVSGTNLTNNVAITAPAGYEISSNNGTTWNNSSNPVVLAPVSGTLANTPVAVRLNAASAGTYNDSLVHTSVGAVTVKLAVAGTVQSTPLVISKALLWWPFATGNTDSAALRSDKVAASTTRLKNLYVSQGFNTGNIPAYSTTYGQALSGTLGTSAANDGSWGTAVGGPGSNLSRNHYEEFTIKANSTVAVRVDSFLLKAAFTSSANGRLAAVYSRTGFTTNDSTNISGAPFSSPIALAQYNSVTDIRLALNGGAGLTLASGDSLTVRVYLSLGSNNVPRFAVLKDVMFKGADSTSSSPGSGGGGGGGATTQQPAFPGAEGAGMYTSGGRGTVSQPTTVFEVTSLDDTNTPGTLRYAVQASSVTYPYRTIVFRVSGTIHLLSKLNIRGNTTIAGQTAPGDGICLADWPVVISGDNVILRYVRVRMGDKNQLKTNPAGCGLPVAPFTAACAPIDGSGGDDALGNLGNKNIIIDHCSVSWSSDEALTVYRGDSVTLQWNFIEEPLNYSYHFETGDTDFENHGFGGIWGSLHGSFHHNLIANTKSRAPRWGGNNTYAAGETEQGDFRNNVIYNWELYNVYGGEGGNYNLVNNYYKYGPVTGSATKFRIVNVDSNASFGYAQYYLNGNYVDGSPTNTANNWSGAYMMSGNAADTVRSKHTTPFLSTYPQITTQSATDAYESVLNGAGAVLPRRDTLDQRIVNNVRYRTGRLIDVQGGYPHGTPYAQTLNAWPNLNSTTAPGDTDHDGMPDTWETSNGLNLNDATDRQAIASNGYTNLENYLNGITNISPEVYFSGSPATFVQTGTTPSQPQTVVLSGTNLSGNVVLTAPAGYEISIDGGTTWVASSSFITLIPANLNGTTLSIRLNSGSNGTYTNYITAVTAGAASFYQYVTGNRTSASATASVIWPLLNTPDPTVTGGVIATGQTLGSAIGGTQYGSSFGNINGWQRAASTTNLPIGYNANSYVEYTITPPAGRTFTVTSFSMAALGGGTGSARMAVYYSTDGFTTSASIGSLTYNGIAYANSTDNTNSVSLLNTSTTPLTGQQIASASPNITVTPGRTLSIRVYAWITGTGNRYFASQNVMLSGSLSDAALPLNLLHFSATEENRRVKLIWNTAQEKNTARFEVESSADALHFTTVGTVTAKAEPGNNSYNFTDPQLLDGIRYYRLKMIDIDGSFSRSKTITVDFHQEGRLTLFPNPASEAITATYPVQTSAGKLQVISSDGKVLLTVVLPAGTTRTGINVKALASGLYFIKLSGANQVASFIKQ